ncbi:unnamed protein product [Amoebophrya sp. A120]|nr:unnamed protein product [Amoebophrya sp. A120]|eukprot:GSA120T00003007001.1
MRRGGCLAAGNQCADYPWAHEVDCRAYSREPRWRAALEQEAFGLRRYKRRAEANCRGAPSAAAADCNSREAGAGFRMLLCLFHSVARGVSCTVRAEGAQDVAGSREVSRFPVLTQAVRRYVYTAHVRPSWLGILPGNNKSEASKLLSADAASCYKLAEPRR